MNSCTYECRLFPSLPLSGEIGAASQRDLLPRGRGVEPEHVEPPIAQTGCGNPPHPRPRAATTRCFAVPPGGFCGWRSWRAAPAVAYQEVGALASAPKRPPRARVSALWHRRSSSWPRDGSACAGPQPLARSHGVVHPLHRGGLRDHGAAVGLLRHLFLLLNLVSGPSRRASRPPGSGSSGHCCLS